MPYTLSQLFWTVSLVKGSLHLIKHVYHNLADHGCQQGHGPGVGGTGQIYWSCIHPLDECLTPGNAA